MSRILSAVAALFLVSCISAAPSTQPPAAARQPLVDVPFVGVQDVFGRNAIGDAIVIYSVRGESDRIGVGGAYEISGAYTLASHDSAILAAFVTAQADAPHRPMIDGQSKLIQKGSGLFTLRLKVEDAGWPHVSFYPKSGGERFAAEYFGTGDFVPPAKWQVASTTGR